MPGTSPEGWPYILDDDHPIEYPAYSQSLATLMDSRWDTWQTASVMTPVTGWADLGASYAGLLATRAGGMVTLEGMLKRTGAPVDISAQTQMATVPPGFRPVHDINTITVVSTSGYPSARLILNTVGNLHVQTGATLSLPTNGWVAVCLTYRGA